MALVAKSTLDPTAIGATGGANVPSDQTDFVHYVPFDTMPAAFWSTAKSDGSDLRVQIGATELPREIVDFDAVAETGGAWVKQTGVLDSSSDVVLDWYADGTSAEPVSGDAGFSQDVWTDYAAVLHLNTSSYTDSTGNGYDGTANSAPTQTSTDHPWGGTWTDFDGTDDYLNIGNVTELNNSYMTVQAIVKQDAQVPVYDQGIVSNRLSSQGNNYFQFSGSNFRSILRLHDGTGENSAFGLDLGTTAAQWVAGTTSATAASFYNNGSLEGQDTTLAGDNQFSTTIDTYIGTYFNLSADRTISAKIGEVRLRAETLSADWLAAEYNNQSAPTSYWTNSAASGDTTAPILSSPTGTATGQTTASGTVSTDEANGTLYWVVTESATSPSPAQVQAGQDNSGSAAAASGSQAVSATGSQGISATGLTAGTTYYIHYQHEDAAGNDSDVESSASFATALPEVSADLHSISLATEPATVSTSVEILAELTAVVNEIHTAAVSLNTALGAQVASLALLVPGADVSQGNAFAIPLQEIAVQTYAGSIASGASVAASVGALALASNPAQVLSGVQVAAALSSLDLSSGAADIQGGATIGAAAAEVALAPFPAGVTLQVQVAASIADFSLEQLVASVGLGAQFDVLASQFEITPQGVAVTLDEGLTPEAHAMALTMFSAQVTGTATALLAPGLEFTIPYNRLHYSLPINRIHFTFTDED